MHLKSEVMNVLAKLCEISWRSVYCNIQSLDVFFYTHVPAALILSLPHQCNIFFILLPPLTHTSSCVSLSSPPPTASQTGGSKQQSSAVRYSQISSSSSPGRVKKEGTYQKCAESALIYYPLHNTILLPEQTAEHQGHVWAESD